MNISQGAYNEQSDIVDFILGITYEIWEQRGVELINRYYAADCVVYAMDGITRGADAVVTGTWKMLDSFPDRVLLAENVIWSGSRESGYYTSHRLLSEMTNKGPTPFGPAKGKKVRIRNIADCQVKGGQVVGEWLVRDNLALVRQLGVAPQQAAQVLLDQRTDELVQWLAAERQRVQTGAPTEIDADWMEPGSAPQAFAWQAMSATWGGDASLLDQVFAPYCTLYRNPLDYFAGREALGQHYQALRDGIGDLRYCVDHVACQKVDDNLADIAVRWTVSGTHAGELLGVAASGRPVTIMGITHWRCVDGRVAMESTVFDQLALMSQLLAD